MLAADSVVGVFAELVGTNPSGCVLIDTLLGLKLNMVKEKDKKTSSSCDEFLGRTQKKEDGGGAPQVVASVRTCDDAGLDGGEPPEPVGERGSDGGSSVCR